jgi:hypothetical protein
VISLGTYRNQKDAAMNAENPVQIDLFGVSATGTKDTRLAEQSGGYARGPVGGARTSSSPGGAT